MPTKESIGKTTDPGEKAPSLPWVDLPGLSAQEVQAQIEAGKTNDLEQKSSRSLWQIIRANVFTLFNAIIFVAMVMVLITGYWKDALFGFVLIINTGIGIFSEVKSKRTLDRLSILVQAPYIVHRDGKDQEIAREKIVQGDLLWIRSGEQVPADGEVLEDFGLELDESVLTGESRTVKKKVGEAVRSGSTAIAGLALVRVTAVGADSYAAKLTAQVKKFTKTHSDLNDGINKILKVMTFVGIPMVFLLAWSQIRIVGGWNHALATGLWRQADVSAVSGVVGMIPEGLVLLTSLNFAIAAMKLARQNTLVQELDAVETLARVDALNLDKTGTITDGGIVFDRLELVGRKGSAEQGKSDGSGGADVASQAHQALYDLSDEESPNATARAVLAYFDQRKPGEGEVLSRPDLVTGAKDGIEADIKAGAKAGAKNPIVSRLPFSSARKWSSIVYADGRQWYFGAPEVLLTGSRAAVDAGTNQPQELDVYRDLFARISLLANEGSRVLLLATVPPQERQAAEEEGLETINPALQPVGLVVCSESIRSDAGETLAWFREQGVRCRVISGDNPGTVAAIAEKVGLTGQTTPRYMDARNLPTDLGQLSQALEDVDVLGRVLPEQKKAIVQALHKSDHTVAMTGDGVNDALALKEADLGIAMGNAAPATKAVAQVVLVDSKFSHLPSVVARGRQVMANMERVASLFLVKTVYSVLISLGVVLTFIPFPYLPRHITYIGGLTIGIPAFILALAPNTRRYIPGFLKRVVAFAFPGGIAAGLSVLLTAWIVPRAMGWGYQGTNLSHLRTICGIVLFCISIAVLARVARPLRSWRGGLVLAFFLLGVAGAAIPFVARFFEIHVPDGPSAVATIIAIAVGLAVFCLCYGVQSLIQKGETGKTSETGGTRETKKKR